MCIDSTTTQLGDASPFDRRLSPNSYSLWANPMRVAQTITSARLHK